MLFEPCPNPHLLDLVHRGWARLSGLRDSTFTFVPGRAQHSVEEHAEILELIRDGADPLEIELAARDHRLAHDGRLPRRTGTARSHRTRLENTP